MTAPGLEITIDRATLRRARQRLAALGNTLPRALAWAVNDTTRRAVLFMGRQIRQRVDIKKRDIDHRIRIWPRATPQQPSARITLSPGERLGLTYFGAKAARGRGTGPQRRDARGRMLRSSVGGLSYRIDKQQGRRFVAGGFLSAELGGHAFKRATKRRLPIERLEGPSPWGVFVRARAGGPTRAHARELLRSALERRVNYLALKARGAL